MVSLSTRLTFSSLNNIAYNVLQMKEVQQPLDLGKLEFFFYPLLDNGKILLPPGFTRFG
jgi:hypothetical protein